MIALSGLGALANEVAWTRALALLIGPTAYAFAFIVTSVVAGLALGSAAAAAVADRLRRPGLALGLVEIGAAALSLAVVEAIGRLPVVVAQLVRDNADRMPRLMSLEFAAVFVLLAPPAFLFGAAFPLAVRLAGGRGPADAVGRAYAWNTAGAIAGALLAGFVALPRLGLQATLLAAAGVHALAGAGAVALARPGRARLRFGGRAARGRRLRRAAPSAPGTGRCSSGGAYKYAAYAPPDRLEEELRAGDLVYYREGAARHGVREAAGGHAVAGGGRQGGRDEHRRHAHAAPARPRAAAAAPAAAGGRRDRPRQRRHRRLRARARRHARGSGRDLARGGGGGPAVRAR